MKKYHTCIPLLLSLSFAIFFHTPAIAEPANLSHLKTEIKAYHESGEYYKELTAVITKAQECIINRVNLNKQQAHPQKLAVVLDIDETSLSNYDSMAAREFGGADKPWKKEVLTGKATAIEPMLSLYNLMLKEGIYVFFVTGRTESQRLPTHKNLNDAGYYHWSGLYLKPETYQHESAIQFKSNTRALIAQQDYTIIATIGDQESDLKGGYAEQGFKLPNPYYYIP